MIDYFEFRANALKSVVEPNLMDRETAKAEFTKLEKNLKSKIPIPFNKQKAEKRHPAYLTAIINRQLEWTPYTRQTSQ